MEDFKGVKGTIYKANGEMYDFTKASSEIDLKFLQESVGGYIEMVWLDEELVMVVDEEGKLKDKPINTKATQLYQKKFGPVDFIVGDVVVCERKYIT